MSDQTLWTCVHVSFAFTELKYSTFEKPVPERSTAELTTECFLCLHKNSSTANYKFVCNNLVYVLSHCLKNSMAFYSGNTYLLTLYVKSRHEFNLLKYY